MEKFVICSVVQCTQMWHILRRKKTNKTKQKQNQFGWVAVQPVTWWTATANTESLGGVSWVLNSG